MIRTAVIGVGSMGWNHARVYNELQGVNLVAVADLDGRVAEQAAHIYGARSYTDYQQMLSREELDVVSIAVPTLTMSYFGDVLLLPTQARLAGAHPIDQMLHDQGGGLLC